MPTARAYGERQFQRSALERQHGHDDVQLTTRWREVTSISQSGTGGRQASRSSPTTTTAKCIPSRLSAASQVAWALTGTMTTGGLTSLGYTHNGDAITTGGTGTPAVSYAMQYDPAGNITQASRRTAPTTTRWTTRTNFSRASLTSENYTYDQNGNRTNGGYATGADNRLLSDGTYDYQYDADGNRTARLTPAHRAGTQPRPATRTSRSTPGTTRTASRRRRRTRATPTTKAARPSQIVTYTL